MLVDARGGDVFEMVMPRVARHLLNPILRVFADAVCMADVEVEADHRRVDATRKIQILLKVFDQQARLGLDQELHAFAFGVPSFEEHLGLTNELLAMECEAHAGLHVMGDFDYLHLDRNSCACGNPAPRFPKRPRIAELVDMLA